MSDRPNLLLITTDQHRADCIGIERAGHPVMTPHLDQLACEGVRFSRAYTDCPLCIPSRTTIMTGKCASSHGVVRNGKVPLPESPERTLPGRLLAEGYQTHAAGKMQFHPPRNRNGFERMRLVPEDYVDDLEKTLYRGMHRGHGLGGNEIYPVFSAMPAEYTPTHWTVEESVGFLRQRDPAAPFFLWTSFESPHPPYDAPESFVRLYDGRTVPAPTLGEWTGEREPAWVRDRKFACKLDLMDEETILAARKHYYAVITHIDYTLGRLFGELKSQGLWENTMIVFTADHGEMLGDHGLFHKSCFYEPSARVPLIVKPARSVPLPLRPGSICERPVMLADLYPTFMEAAGCDRTQEDASRDGESLIGAMQADGSRLLFGHILDQGAMYMATNEEWKYLYFTWDGREQLFHLREDPQELRDLSDSPQEPHRRELAAFRQRLAARFADHPIVEQGRLKLGEEVAEANLPEWELRSHNRCAWRGPYRPGGGG